MGRSVSRMDTQAPSSTGVFPPRPGGESDPRTETRALAQSQCTPPGQHQSPDLPTLVALVGWFPYFPQHNGARRTTAEGDVQPTIRRSEEHTSELQSREKLVSRLLLEQTNQ